MNDLRSQKTSMLHPAEGTRDSLRFREFFAPESVAVLGASPKPGNLGGGIVQSLRAQGYPGKIFAVHPKGQPLHGVPAARSIDELPDDLDLAIVAVPASETVSLVAPLARKGIRHLIVISGGFAEMGRPGRALQDALKTEAKKHGVRVIGPNGMGVFSAPARFNSFFLLPEAITLPLPGPVALISQSGAFLSLLLDRFSDMGVGVQRAVNFGNRVDVEECELLEAYETDPDISVIGLYLESVVDGARFVEVARRVARTKPIVIWKGGQAGRAGDAARAHSASLTGSYEVFQAACAKAGLIEVQGFDEFLQALEVLALQPPARGDRVLIVSNGGGMGVFLTDLCEKAGLRIPEPSPAQQAQLKNFLPEYYSFKNPIDLTGSGTNEQCSQAVDLLLQSGEFDALLLVLLAGTTGITPEVTRPLRGRFSAPLPVVVGAYGRTLAPALRTEFLKDGVPVFFSAEAATRALKILVDQGRNLREVHRPASDWKPHYTPEGEAGWTQWVHDTPDEMQLKSHLRHCGVLVPASVHLKTRRDLEEAVRRLKFPMTLKAVGSEIQHKTELDAVRLFIDTENNLVREWEGMNHAWPGAIWAEEQMPPGLDLMVGAHRSRRFGPVLVFGTGGQYVEIYRDVGRLLLPATEEERLRLVFQTRAGQIIQGVRGQHKLDVERLLDFLKLVSDWIVQEPQIESMDFNPVRLYPAGLVVLDAKMVFRSDYPEGRERS